MRVASRSRSTADASFERPMSLVPWMIWRCRFVTSTTSSPDA
jgi:hypothetical protein